MTWHRIHATHGARVFTCVSAAWHTRHIHGSLPLCSAAGHGARAHAIWLRSARTGVQYTCIIAPAAAPALARRWNLFNSASYAVRRYSHTLALAPLPRELRGPSEAAGAGVAAPRAAMSAANAARLTARVAAHASQHRATRAQRGAAPQRRADGTHVRRNAPAVARAAGRSVAGPQRLCLATSGVQATAVSDAAPAAEPGLSAAAPSAALGVTLHEDGEVRAAPRVRLRRAATQPL